MNLADQPIRSYSKADQLHNTRQKPSRHAISNLSAKEDKRLKERSNGVCEKCDRQRATERAHVSRRHNHSVKPVAEDFVHLCSACHRGCDKDREGRAWLVQFQQNLTRKKDAI
ncbi:MAG: hypothetical protein K0Q73_7206 [Paenibacillus sp.]|jgi:hypothetical protein|nr:hypothetical protein [Paenibacillus sp.]